MPRWPAAILAALLPLLPPAALAERTRQAQPVAATRPAPRALPSPLARRLEGFWDGATFTRDGGVTRASLLLRPLDGPPPIRDALFRARLWEDDAPPRDLLVMGRGGELRLVAASGLPAASIARFRLAPDQPAPTDALGREELEMEAAGTLRLVRRPAGSVLGTGPLGAWCAGADRWLALRARGREAARQVKVAFFEALDGYDPGAAELAEMLAEDGFARAFGVPLDSLAEPRFEAMMQQLRDCARTAEALPDQLRDGAYHGLFDAAALRQERLHPGRDLPAARLRPLLSLAEAREHARRAAAAEAALPGLVRALHAARDSTGFVARLSAGVAVLQDVRPSLAEAALAPFVGRMDALASERAAVARDARRRQAIAHTAGTLPRFEMLPARWRGVATAIWRGEAVSPAPAATAFLGGFAGAALARCDWPAEGMARDALEAMARDALEGMARDVLARDGSAEGGRAAEAFPCTDPFLRAFLLTLADHAAAPSGARPLARLPLFLRSCSLDFDRPACECLVREAEPVLGSLNGRTDVRAVLRDTSQARAVQASGSGLCGIGGS